jgi:hypothetical protein
MAKLGLRALKEHFRVSHPILVRALTVTVPSPDAWQNSMIHAARVTRSVRGSMPSS